VPVTNTGDRPGAEVVQVYVAFPDAGAPRPARLLRAFGKVSLDPGETRRLSLTVRAADLARYEPDGARWIVDPGEYRALVGTSSARADLSEVPFEIR